MRRGAARCRAVDALGSDGGGATGQTTRTPLSTVPPSHPARSLAVFGPIAFKQPTAVTVSESIPFAIKVYTDAIKAVSAGASQPKDAAPAPAQAAAAAQ